MGPFAKASSVRWGGGVSQPKASGPVKLIGDALASVVVCE